MNDDLLKVLQAAVKLHEEAHTNLLGLAEALLTESSIHSTSLISKTIVSRQAADFVFAMEGFYNATSAEALKLLFEKGPTNATEHLKKATQTTRSLNEMLMKVLEDAQRTRRMPTSPFPSPPPKFKM